MSEELPSVSVIIAARPDQTEIKAVDAAQQLDYPKDRLQLLVARGKQPSVQRNAALKAARHEWIYFLDDDSVPPPGNLRHAVVYLKDPAVKMVGGPNLCPPDAPPLEQTFAMILASWAFGPSRARYAPVGKIRATGEKELILCNLMARREAMLELGGFNEALYPNEENALMDELQKRGGKLIYDPHFIVHRRPRRTLRAFVKMLMTYGRGRAEQFRVHPTFGSALNFVPPLFALYLLLLIVLEILPLGGSVAGLKLWLAAPLGLYLLGIFVHALAWMPTNGVWPSLRALPLLAISPILYGIGIWRGFFTSLKTPGEGTTTPPVSVETIAC